MVQRPSAAFTNTATCNKPPTKSVYFCLKCRFSLTVSTNLPYDKQQKTNKLKLSLTYKQFSRHYRWRCLEYLTPTLFFSGSNELIGPNSMGAGYDYSYLRRADYCSDHDAR